MNYQQFVTEIKEKVTNLLDSSLKIEIITVTKNNGLKRTGLNISNPEVNLAPTIYLEEFYETYQPSITLDDIANEIARIYENVRYQQNMDFNYLTDYELAKSFIIYKLINYEKNKDSLEKIPHKTFMDLALVTCLYIHTDEHHSGTVTINYDLLKLWNISEEELFDWADQNTPRLLPAEFQPMYDVMSEMLNNKSLIPCPDDSPLYVLTNETRMLGAACILYDFMMDLVAFEIGENFYIIPSSIHEVIIIPESKSPPKNELDAMIQEINQSQIITEEILSDHAYYYNIAANDLS